MIVGYPTFTAIENGGLCRGEPEIAGLAARDTPADRSTAPRRAVSGMRTLQRAGRDGS